MIITCPNCFSEYEIHSNEISKNGRKTKCFTCGSLWVQLSNGKTTKIKIMQDFLNEIKIRQESIKTSLQQNNSDQKYHSQLSKEQEREFLTALAIEEIQQTNTSEKNDKLTNKISEKLNSPQNKGRGIKRLNRTFFGFILVSIVFLIGLIIYLQRDLLMLPESEHRKYLEDFFNIIEIFIEQIQHHILNVIGLIFIN